VSHKLYRIGAIDQITSNRENICYFVDVVHDSSERGLELLADAVLRPTTTAESVALAVEDLTFRSNYMMADLLTRDAMSMAAYKGSSLGNFHYPINMPRVGQHTPEKVEQFRSSVLYGGNCVLAAAGMRHEELVSMAKKYFGGDNLPSESSTSAPARSPAKYTGGMYVEKRELQEPFVQLAIGYEVGGYKSESLYAMCVLEKLLGGGSSFSAGGPGKGMYTRLYLDVLNQHHWIESAQSFVVPHQDNGILGIDASCKGENIQYLYQVILNEFLRLATEDVTPIELNRAKNMLRSQLMMQLESRIVICEDIARQYATYGERVLPEMTCEKIEKVTTAEIRNLVRTMLAQPPSIVCIGEDVSQLPTYEQLCEFTMKKTMEAINGSSSQ
jgi:processing peptidase subunit alpha